MNNTTQINLFTKAILFFKVVYFGVSNVILMGSLEKKWAEQYIQKLERDFGAKLNSSVVKRTVVSFGGFIPLASNAFTRLRNRTSNLGERERLLLYFLCSAIFDDFTDKKELSSDDLYQISFHPEEYQPKRIEEKIFLHAHLKLRAYVKNKTLYHSVVTELFQVQKDSANQFNSFLSEDELKHITFTKGGSSTLLCHFYLDLDASEIEQKCWRQLGVLFQLTDDLLDIYDDLQVGQETLPIRIKDVHVMTDFFEEQMEIMKNLIAKLPFPYKSKEQMVFSIASICSVGWIALHQLSTIQGDQSEIANIKAVERKALIVDMAKISNLLFCTKFTYDTSIKWINDIHFSNGTN